MDAVKFLKEWKRMCDACSTDCADCSNECGFVKEFNGKQYDDLECWKCAILFPDRAVKAVSDWSEANPQRTYLTDFMEKYPNAHLRDGYPQFVPCLLGYCQDCGKCGVVGHEERFRECWNQPLE